MTYTPERIEEWRKLAEKTHGRVPAQPERDLDLLVGRTCEALTQSLSEIERLTARLAEAEKRMVKWRGPEVFPELGDRDGETIERSICGIIESRGTRYIESCPERKFPSSDWFDYDELQWIEDNMGGTLIAWCYESELLATLNIGGTNA